MLINCPGCSTKFVVSADMIPAKGKVVRCSVCGHSWRQKALSNDVTSSDDISLVPKDGNQPLVDSAANPSIPIDDGGQNRRSTLWGWVMLIAVLLILLLAALLFRREIAEKFPQTQRFYDAVTSAEHKAGAANPLTPKDLKVRYDYRPGGASLTVSGNIENKTTMSLAVPRLAVRYFDAQGQVLLERLIEKPFGDDIETIPPASVLGFTLVVDNAPAGIADVQVEVLP